VAPAIKEKGRVTGGFLSLPGRDPEKVVQRV